jgi:uncharacterized iron-regulated protein
MRTKTIKNAKLIVRVESDRNSQMIKTVSMFDNRNQEYLTDEYIEERNVKNFLDLNDLKETLNWNLNGDGSKYQFKWGQSGKSFSEGVAYVFQ